METRKQVRYCRCGTRLAGDNTGALCSACQRKSPETLLTAPSVPPEFWMTDRMQDAFSDRHMGRIIYAYRTHSFHGKTIPQAVVAGWACISQTQLSRIESGPALHDLVRLMHWAHTLRIPRRLLWFELGKSSEISDPPRGKRLPVVQAEEVSPSQRRDFIALGGLGVAGVASQAFTMLERELDMIHMTLDRGTTSEERTAHLEGIASDLGVQVIKVAPLTLVQPALITLHSIRALLEERQPTRQQVRLIQASARLSTVVGEIMFNVGQFGKAREWYKTAEHAAFDVGDRYLADIALAGQAYLPTYSDDPRGVIALLMPRLGSNPVPTPAIAWLWGFKARAHASLGEPDEFQRSIERAQEALGRSRPELVTTGICSFLPEKLAFYEATGAVRLARPDSAVSAADRALSLYDPSETTEPALARLERASALVQSGEVPEACRVAKDALVDPNTYHGVTVRTYAGRFDELVRGIQLPETREWREVHAGIYGRKRAIAGPGERET